jgi:predicted mannosyl-3-phosphoglycerate phosphatase (HAD superfamily)
VPPDPGEFQYPEEGVTAPATTLGGVKARLDGGVLTVGDSYYDVDVPASVALVALAVNIARTNRERVQLRDALRDAIHELSTDG